MLQINNDLSPRCKMVTSLHVHYSLIWCPALPHKVIRDNMARIKCSGVIIFG